MVLSRKRRDHSEYNAIYLITGRKRDRRETPSFCTRKVTQMLSLSSHPIDKKQLTEKNHRLLGKILKLYQYRTTVFREISVRRSKNCLEFSIARGRLKISRWPFHSHTIFEAYLINSYDFLKFNFSRFTPQIRLFFVEKGNLKFSESKMRCREESEKLSLS